LTCLASALIEFSINLGRSFSHQNFHTLRNFGPEEIEAAVFADLCSHPTVKDFWASETFLGRMGLAGDSLKFKVIESGKFLVSDLQEISRSIEDQKRLRSAAEKIFKATEDEKSKLDAGAWLRDLEISEQLRAEIDAFEFSQLWKKSGFPPAGDAANCMNILFWSEGPFPNSESFWQLAKLAGLNEKQIFADFGIPAIENPPATSPTLKENFPEVSIFARPRNDTLAIARAALICGGLGNAGRDRFFRKLLKITFNDGASNAARCRALDALFSVGRVAEISRAFGNPLDDLCEMRASCIYLRAMERVKHFMTLREFVVAEKPKLVRHLLSLNKRSNEVMQLVAAMVIDFEMQDDPEVLGAVKDCLKLQGRSEVAMEIRKVLNSGN
jgi:hypothetical protein